MSDRAPGDDYYWHPRDHEAALRETQCLSLEECGAYTKLLDLIFDRKGPFPDDPRLLAGLMRVTLRRWSVLRAKLIETGLIYPSADSSGRPFLMNERAVAVIEEQRERARKARENGALGGRKSAEIRANTQQNQSREASEASSPAQAIEIDTEIDTPPAYPRVALVGGAQR